MEIQSILLVLVLASLSIFVGVRISMYSHYTNTDVWYKISKKVF